MLSTYTAKFTRIESGYMGQLVEWPEVVTEGKDLDDCRAMLRDALNEMILAHKEQGREVPAGNSLQNPFHMKADCKGTLRMKP